MRIRGWQYSLLLALLVLVGASLRPFAFVWAEAPSGRSSLSMSASLERVPTQVDFDDDRVLDTLTFTARGGHPDVEISLGNTRTVFVLPVDSVSPVIGSLAVRDLDRDGDEDLLWQGVQVLVPAEVIVWLNDGTGQFARVLPPGSVLSQPTPGFSWSTDFPHPTRTHLECSLQRNPLPLGVLSSARIRSNRARTSRDVRAAHPIESLLQQFPSTRAPPAHLSEILPSPL
jgi:hypothetical protein